jgi:2-aminoethylphosphonate-pyruvate transaminase
MVDMSATILHHGHIRLIKRASQFGKVIIGLTSDDEIKKSKGYIPELSFSHRKEILESITEVAEVVETPWLITEEILNQHKIDQLVHGDDNSNHISSDRLLVFPRTKGVSSNDIRQEAQKSLVSIANQKLMLTPGPAVILHENLSGLKPVFGRGDIEYQSIYEKVIHWLKELSGQEQIISAQGSATFAIELAARTFVNGKVLVVSTGYYSDRLPKLLPKSIQVDVVPYDQLEKVTDKYDWVMCAYTETSKAFKLNLELLKSKVDALKAKLFVDATGSIGLESGHELADVMAFSSCKSLFGLTGACFIAHKSGLKEQKQDSFYFNIDTHRQKNVTGPYHAICSLYDVMPIHNKLVKRVKNSKQIILNTFKRFIPSSEDQPLLCTYLNGIIKAKDDNVVLYSPRLNMPGSIVCHLGEVHHDELNLIKRISVNTLDKVDDEK